MKWERALYHNDVAKNYTGFFGLIINMMSYSDQMNSSLNLSSALMMALSNCIIPSLSIAFKMRTVFLSFSLTVLIPSLSSHSSRRTRFQQVVTPFRIVGMYRGNLAQQTAMVARSNSSVVISSGG